MTEQVLQHWFHSEGYTDLSVMREQANRKLHDIHDPSEVIIHNHAHGQACEGSRHFEFRFDQTPEPPKPKPVVDNDESPAYTHPDSGIYTWRDSS
jgi:hypothetical protein